MMGFAGHLSAVTVSLTGQIEKGIFDPASEESTTGMPTLYGRFQVHFNDLEAGEYRLALSFPADALNQPFRIWLNGHLYGQSADLETRLTRDDIAECSVDVLSGDGKIDVKFLPNASDSKVEIVALALYGKGGELVYQLDVEDEQWSFDNARIWPASVYDSPDSGQIAMVAQLLTEAPVGLGTPISDRESWNAWGELSAVSRLVERAARLRQEPTPVLNDDLYLDYFRTGKREPYEGPMGERMYRLTHFVIAECVENQGRYLPSIHREITAIINEKVWVSPAHDKELKIFNGESVEVDLAASGRAWNLATALWLLENRISADLRMRVIEVMRKKVLDPYLRCIEDGRLYPGMSWMRIDFNWNPVCTSGVVGAALAVLESREERAPFVAQAMDSVPFYLDGYTDDGYTSEGLNYWNYGYGHFVLLAEAVRLASKGQINFFELEKARVAAEFPLKFEIINERYPVFSDVAFGDRPKPWLLEFIHERMGIGPESWSRDEPYTLASAISFGGTLYSVAAVLNLERGAKAVESKEAFKNVAGFPDAGIFIFRSSPNDSMPSIGIAVKAGHNDENHNHNDVGSYSLVVGDALLVSDPGMRIYDKSSWKDRYGSKILNSYGHPVPVVGKGDLQGTGRHFEGVVESSLIEDELSIVTIDLTMAYPCPDLDELERTVSIDEVSGSIEIEDAVSFDKPSRFETGITSFYPVEFLGDNRVVIRSDLYELIGTIDTGGAPFSIVKEEIVDNLPGRKIPIRLGVRFDDLVKNGYVKITFKASLVNTF
ncbi:hypothetical protein [Rubellicoccus peritrichatus]|uniref:Heparinase II/III-like protein n=1 Tax=Rubellicoccus peritrichatus TaxID=3080537 RepID=A0AAQ3LF76_9BACT|nr:hypothetical protein [Puniceicoccus sp. CR14]WOO42598.1 hypothetical protein RZN69_05805 [Puniceicoccus sp. CR14]